MSKTVGKTLLKVGALGVLLAGSAAFAANPLTSMKTAFDTQTTNNVIPMLIFWIMIFGSLVAFLMKQWMPLVMAIIIAVVLGMSPTLSTGFTNTDFTV